MKFGTVATAALAVAGAHGAKHFKVSQARRSPSFFLQSV